MLAPCLTVLPCCVSACCTAGALFRWPGRSRLVCALAVSAPPALGLASVLAYQPGRQSPSARPRQLSLARHLCSGARLLVEWTGALFYRGFQSPGLYLSGVL